MSESLGHVIRFDSFSEFVERGQTSNGGESRKMSRNNWFGTKTYDDAVKLAETGIQDHRDRVELIVDSVTHKVREMIQAVPFDYFDVSGAEVDVARFVEGEPECMREYSLHDAPKHGKVVRVLVQGFVSAAVSEDVIARRGAAIVALIDALALCNLTVEIWWECAVRGAGRSRKTASMLVKLNDAATAIDPDVLMYALTHPSMFRRHALAVGETDETFRVKYGFKASGYYGYPADVQCGELIDADVIVGIPTNYDECVNQPERWVQHVMESVGVTFGES